MSPLLRRSLLSLPIAGLVFSALCLTPAQSATSEPARPKIGFLMDSLKVERWQTDLDTFQKRAKELGAEVLVETADGDDDLQLQQSRKLMDAGAKVLGLVPHDTDKAARIVSAAKARNVEVLCYERMVRNSNIDFFVGVDAAAIGELQASSLVHLAPKGNYVLIGGSPTDINAKIIHDGQMRVLQPLIDRGDIRIMADVYAKDWDPAEAYALMREALESSKGNVTAVVAANDGTAIIRILSGTQTMTVYRLFSLEAKLAAEAAVDLGAGTPVKNAVTISSGAQTVPALFVTPVVVTKDNVKQTVIKDGFQNLDTIQKSLPKDKWPQ